MAGFQENAKFLKKFLEVWKRLLTFAIRFGKCPKGRPEKIFEKDLADSKIVLIFAIPFAI